MGISRREFSIVAGSALAIGAMNVRAWARHSQPENARKNAEKASETWFEWKKVAENAWAGIGEGGNSLAVFDEGEWMLVDTKNAGYGDALRREAAALHPDSKLARVINTHHHADHTGGNYAFAPEIAITAHAQAIPRVREQVERYKERLKGVPAQLAKSEKPGARAMQAETEKLVAELEKLTADRFVPAEAIEGDTEIKVGSRGVRLRHFGPAHTDNDMIVHLPELNLLHTGDLLFMGRHPVIDVNAGATTAGWLASLAKLIEICDDKTVVVPGHGDITDVNGLRRQVKYFETVRAEVKAARGHGRTRDEVLRLPLTEFKEYGSPERARGMLGAAYDEMQKGE